MRRMIGNRFDESVSTGEIKPAALAGHAPLIRQRRSFLAHGSIVAADQSLLQAARRGHGSVPIWVWIFSATAVWPKGHAVALVCEALRNEAR